MRGNALDRFLAGSTTAGGSSRKARVEAPRPVGKAAGAVVVARPRARAAAEDVLMTQAEAAEFLRCTDRYIRELEGAGQLRRVGQVGRRPLYTLASLLDYMQGRAERGRS